MLHTYMIHVHTLTHTHTQAQKKLQDEELAHLAELKRLGVDLTKYLETQNPKPDQVLRIITQGGGSNVHIHP